MAVDAKAVVTFGYLPTLTAQLWFRIVTFGWLGTIFVPPGGGGAIDTARGLSIRLRRAHKL